MKKQLITAVAALLVAGTVCGSAAQANYKNSSYIYTYKKGDYQDTGGRYKDYSGSNTPHGYGYAICGDGKESSVKMMKRVKNTPKYVQCSEYVTIPRYVHTNIRNNYRVSKDAEVKLRVRDNTNKGYTGGYWSPDSSKKYKRVVG